MCNSKINLVSKLNEELFEKYKEVVHCFSYNTNGIYEMICFDSETLWQSNEDDRIFNEDENDYEPMETFIRRVYNRYLKDLNKLKL